ncbi:hypothetical protein BJAS_P3420 [Bathymodiolus japonicus methanotrophic gill symbiont]|uniref:hypothetical protein n=1 Tax=Bathymodiolus japonicus methanotrophic gill symbiont TaxID=113269 RepID=UPI001B71F8C8|nr:hypothetical protein [Bathymodiolus japonicus methanotrophic gill symbiont]GFO72884.1 hypothetical protein BJAS_P3420 [Bathymodiolus japonicus methanotrophic gill symbiont]
MNFDASFIDHQYTSNIVYLESRHLSTSLGRFITQDVKKQFYSHYNYGNGTVILHSDPTGNLTPLGSEVEDEVAESAISSSKPNEDNATHVGVAIDPKLTASNHLVILSGDVRARAAISRNLDKYVSHIDVTDSTRAKIKKDLLETAVRRFHELSEKDAKGELEHSIHSNSITERQELSMYRDIMSRNNKEMESLGATDEMSREMWDKHQRETDQFNIDEIPDFNYFEDESLYHKVIIGFVATTFAVGAVVIFLKAFNVF